MSGKTYDYVSSGLAFSQNFYTTELIYTVPANGTVWPLIANQGAAQGNQWIINGNASATFTAALGYQICDPLDGSDPKKNPNTISLVAGLLTYFATIPAPAAGAYCTPFIVSGFSSLAGLIGVELDTLNGASASAANFAKNQFNYGNVAVIQDPITLSGTNTLLKNPNDPTSGIVYGTDTLVIVPSMGVVFGALRTVFTTDVAAVGDIAKLILKVTP